MKLGEALKMGLAKSIEIDDFSEYTIAGVQSYGKGVINRRNELGKNLKMKKYQVIEPNYLMWCKVDTKNGAFGITKEEHRGSLASTNMALAKIDIEKFNPSFLEKLFSFDFFHKNITHLSSGSTNRKYLTPKQLFEMIEIPAISKSEQDEFISLVNKIDNINLNSEFTYQLDLIKQLRQAFLREAMQGKLCHAVPTLRDVSASQETGHDLLAKIKAEKAQLIAEKKLKKEKELPPITEEEIPFEIPEHWAWCRLGEICLKITDGFHNTPPKVSKGFPYIAATQVKSDKIDWENCNYVEEKFHRELYNKTTPKKGEILVVNIGAGCGTPAIIDVDFEFSFKNTAILKFNQELIFNKYLFYYFILRKDEFYSNLTKGGLQPFLSLKILNEIDFPLPPLHEQEQIVAKLEELMAFCDGLEQSIKESQGYNEMLLQQVLREALQGKEVENE
ncbi:restriction endonuclease subunit S [Flavobacterium sp.]|uniref:restriction endonuclease subunit S n=1 Tax=Flavobacterium sp. TaxID=239 RepID=UPI004048A170